MTNPTVDLLARTLWGEARGCGRLGMIRVANVISNRKSNPRWWGHDFTSVCRQPYQFSCWNYGDPNLPQVLAVTTRDTWFTVALSVASLAVSGALADLTGGADSYYAKSMLVPPSWTKRAVHTIDDQWHSFWRVELPDPAILDSRDPGAPTVGHNSASPSADDLNDIELQRVRSIS